MSDATTSHVAENAQAALRNAQAGLAALEGSEKQVMWAEGLRETTLQYLEAAIPIAEAMGDWAAYQALPDDERDAANQRAIEIAGEQAKRFGRMQDAYSMQHQARHGLRTAKTIAALHALRDIVRGQTRASWFIDHRNASLDDLAREYRRDLQEQTDDMKDIIAQAQAEAVMKPSGEAICHSIAEVQARADVIEVVFERKIEAFRVAIKSLGFLWSGRCWAYPLDARSGDPIDRLAEIAHRLTAAGFIVRLHDAQARQRALDASYQPRKTRWISVGKTGKYSGWAKISWSLPDDLYHAARSLPGSRYKTGAVYVPSGAIEAVMEFAGQNDFSISPGAQEMLRAHRAALAGGAVITNIYKAPEPLAAKAPGVPAKLKIGASDIDASLLDDGEESEVHHG